MQVLWNIDYGDILPFGIINRIFRPALLTVEDGDHTASVVDHPFIAALVAATIILWRNETDDIGTGQNRSIATLLRWRPCTFKALIRGFLSVMPLMKTKSKGEKSIKG